MSRNEEVEVESAILLHQLTHWRNLFLFAQDPGSTVLRTLLPREGMLLSGDTVLVPSKFNFHWPKADGNQRAKMPIRVMYRVSPPGTQSRVEKCGEWILRGKLKSFSEVYTFCPSASTLVLCWVRNQCP